MAKFILPYNISSTPQSLRDSPGGGTGDRIPQTPCVAPWIFVVLYYENRDHRSRGGGVFLRH